MKEPAKRNALCISPSLLCLPERINGVSVRIENIISGSQSTRWLTASPHKDANNKAYGIDCPLIGRAISGFVLTDSFNPIYACINLFRIARVCVSNDISHVVVFGPDTSCSLVALLVLFSFGRLSMTVVMQTNGAAYVEHKKAHGMVLSMFDTFLVWIEPYFLYAVSLACTTIVCPTIGLKSMIGGDAYGVDEAKLCVMPAIVHPGFCTLEEANTRKCATSEIEWPESMLKNTPATRLQALSMSVTPDIKRLRLLSVGRLDPEKNAMEFAQWAQSTGCSVTLVGKCSKQCEFDAFPRASNIKYTGVLRGPELWNIVRNCDVFIMPSKTETLGLVTLEAMRSGVPVVAFDGPGTCDIITDKVNGVLVSDWDEMTSAVVYAFKHKEFLVASALTRVQEMCGSKNECARFFETLIHS